MKDNSYAKVNESPKASQDFLIRKAKASDLDAIGDICLKTGFYGRDASHLFSQPEMIGRYCALPYYSFDRDFCLVLEKNREVAGYCIGTPSSNSFFEWMESSWLPELRIQYPKDSATKSLQEQQILEAIHSNAIPEPEPWHKDYPAHLHINLLPSAQGSGWGKKLICSMWQLLAAAGAAGVFLSIWKQNAGADGFYRAMGFQELGETETGRLFCKDLKDYNPSLVSSIN